MVATAALSEDDIWVDSSRIDLAKVGRYDGTGAIDIGVHGGYAWTLAPKDRLALDLASSLVAIDYSPADDTAVDPAARNMDSYKERAGGENGSRRPPAIRQGL